MQNQFCKAFLSFILRGPKNLKNQLIPTFQDINNAFIVAFIGNIVACK